MTSLLGTILHNPPTTHYH